MINQKRWACLPAKAGSVCHAEVGSITCAEPGSVSRGQVGSVSAEFPVPTKAMLIQIMQDCGLFPQGQSKSMNYFLSYLLNVNFSTIESARKKVPARMRGTLSTKQKQAISSSLGKLRPILKQLDNKSLSARYEDIMARIETKK